MLNYTPQSSREARRIPRGRSLPKFISKIAEGRSTLGMLPWSAIRGGQSSDKEEREVSGGSTKGLWMHAW